MLENLCVGAGFGALVNGSSGVVDPYPVTDVVEREFFECVGER